MSLFFRIDLKNSPFHNYIGEIKEDKKPYIKSAKWSGQTDFFSVFRDKDGKWNFRDKTNQLVFSREGSHGEQFSLIYKNKNDFSIGKLEIFQKEPTKIENVNSEEIKTYIITCEKRENSLKRLEKQLKEQNVCYEIILQDKSWPISHESGEKNYFNGIKKAWEQNVKKVIILEDDVVLPENFIEKLKNWSGYNNEIGFLYLPNLIKKIPFTIYEDVAIPSKISGDFPYGRLWGSQGIIFNQNMLAKLMIYWEDFKGNHDSKILTICKESNTKILYSFPCLIEHVEETVLNTPSHKATTLWNEEYECSEYIKNFINSKNIIRPDLTSKDDLEVILDLLYKTKDIDGDIVEFGCNEGSTSILLSELKGNKKLYVYDSFQGLPEKTLQDGETDCQSGMCKTTKNKFIDNFKDKEIPIIYEGWFSDIKDEQLPEKISFAFLDGDFYTSIIDSLMLTVPKMSENGIILIHDYNHKDFPGVKAACDRFFGKDLKCYRGIGFWQNKV